MDNHSTGAECQFGTPWDGQANNWIVTSNGGSTHILSGLIITQRDAVF
jgi:hypothetical protein